jgi:hypothetical protein
MKSKALAGIGVALIAGLCSSNLAAQSAPPAKDSISEATQKSRLAEGYGRLPLSFEVNKGQTDPRVKFLSRGAGQTLFLTSNESVLALGKALDQKPDSPGLPNLSVSHSLRATLLRMRLLGANPLVEVTGLDTLPGTSNYFIGNDPARWRTNVPTYSKVRYSQIYPGIDLVYYGNQRQLEYDFVVAPGADPEQIRLSIRGASKLFLDANGNAVLRQKDGDVRLLKPRLYQEVRGEKIEIAGGYALKGNELRFAVGQYDPRQELVIDPVLVYSTYLGGSGIDLAKGIAVDSSGSAYVAGYTGSTNFPLGTAPQQATFGGGNYDVFVAKLTPAGALVYSTYIGGSGDDVANGLAVDSSGNAYVVGSTLSTNFPGASSSSIHAAYGGGGDGFVVELNATGNALIYSSYLGGSGSDAATAIALDSSGNAYVAGETQSTNFPGVTSSSMQTVNAGGYDAFVAKLNPAGTAIVYSTYLGGTADDVAYAIAVDSSGNAFVAGETLSTTFPGVNSKSIQPTSGGGGDGFVAELNAGGTALVYSTYLGGGGTDLALGIALDSIGNAYVTGYTSSTNFPVSSAPFQAASGGGYDGFVAKLNPGGTTLVYSTYLGGSGTDTAAGIAVDPSGNAYVTGGTTSTDFPGMNSGSLQSANGGGASDAFVAELNPAGSALVYSTYLGGNGADVAASIRLDSTNNIYIAGYTGSTNFPLGASPVQSTYGGGTYDAFIAKLSATVTGAATTTTIVASQSSTVFGQQVTFTAAVSPSLSSALTPTGNVTFTDGSTTLGTAALSSGTAIFNTSALTAGGHSVTASYAGDSNFASSTSAALSQTVGQGSTMATVATSTNPGIVGQPVTITVTVTPVAPASGTPTGTVTFLDGTASLGTGTLSGGQATFTTSSVAAGSHSITANYAGDTNFVASTSTSLSLPVKIATTTALTASPNPSNTGQSVLLTATVAFTGSSASTASGTVTFLDGTTTLGTSTLSSGTATFSTSSLSAATHSLTASYGGDTNFASSTSSAVIQTVNLLITINEAIKVTDAPVVLPSVMIPVNESITLADAPTVLPSVMIPVNETISVTDTPAVGNTPMGPNVMVNPIDTTTGTTPVGVTFTNVTQAGITSLITGSTGAPPPPGFQPGTPLVYYDISTNAVYNGPINICINFTGIVFPGSALPHFFHFENGAWVDHTLSVDMTNMIACGIVTSLSPFAIFQASVIPTTTSISAPGVTYGSPASVTVSVGGSGGTVSGSVSLSVDGVVAISSTLANASAVFNLGVLNAGTHSLSANFAGTGSFSASSAAGSLTVTKAPLTVTANGVPRAFGANNPALTGTIIGARNGDLISASFTTAAMPSSPVGSYAITPAGLGPSNLLSNYAVALVKGTLSVVPESTSVAVAFSPLSIMVGQSTTATITLTAPDMVIQIDPSVLAAIAVSSPVASDILSNNGVCTPAPSATTGVASCTITVTSVEPNGRTLNARFAGSADLIASNGTADLIVTAALQSQQVCIASDFRNVAVPGGSYVWFNSIFKVRDVTKQLIHISFFQSSVQFQYTDPAGNAVTVNQALPDAKITIDPNATAASTSFDPINNVWITTIPWDLDDNSFLTGMPWRVPSAGLPADVEPVTVCGTFASDVASVDIGWRWAAASYSGFSSDNTTLGVKPMDTDHDNQATNHDHAGTPENYIQFVIPGARGKGGKNYTGTYSKSAVIE